MNKLIKQAFTLIELLVVIAIIGILSGLIVVTMGGVTTKANIAKAQVFSNSLKNSLMLNLVSEWKFDQINTPAANQTPDSWSGGNTGTLTDTSGACSFTGTLKCPQLVTSGCVSGNCLSFDGTNDYISTSYNTNLNPQTTITIEAWVMANEITTQHPIIGIWGPTTLSYMIDINGSAFEGYIRNGASNRIATSSTIKTGTWYHVVLTYNGGEPSMYINGILDGTLSGTVVSAMTIGTDPLLIGKKGDSVGVWFNGNIDGARIYNAAMSTSQIKEQYYTGLNKLFINGGITQEDYQNRIGELATNL